MELIRGTSGLKPRHRGCVATIGNFDGVHRGHQAIVERVRQYAAELSLASVVITFEPLPQEFFAPQAASPRLTRFREKYELLAALKIDRLLLLRFNQKLAQLSADEFINKILVQGLGIRHLVVGDDFRFGKQRAGDFAMLVQAGEANNFTVENTPTYDVDGRRVSSTWVREALLVGDMPLAEKLLGQPYHLSGTVVHGDKRGRQLGFPTANFYLHRKSAPVNGVFAVIARGPQCESVFGVANVGSRPTVDGGRCRLEVHLFNFDRDIYGQHWQVQLVHFIRPEQKFDGLEALKDQIAKDMQTAKAFFSNHK